MWHPWKRRIAELQARVAEFAEQRDEARTELAASRATVIRLAGRNTRLTEQLELAYKQADDGALEEMGARLDRALRACARYRAELVRTGRDMSRLQARLDDACGLNSAAVQAGQDWQGRRVDTWGRV